MSGETVVTIIGNLTSAPELKFTQSGAAVANFTVASTPRRKNEQTGKWEDGDALFMRCSVWREQAENAAQLDKGDRVLVVGRLVQRSYDTREGEKRTVVELQVEEMGPSVKWKPAAVQRVERSGGQESQTGWTDSAGQDDPWGSPAPRRPAGGFNDEPPF